MYPSLKKIIQPNFTMIGLLLTIYFAIWILNYIYLPDIQNYPEAQSPILPLKPMWHIISIFLISLINVLLIIQINSKYSIIRMKSFLPIFFYTLFISVWKDAHMLWSSHLAFTAFLISLLFFLSMYRNKKAVEESFVGTILISLTGLINPIYLLLIPVSWLGFIILRSISIKVFLASLIGLIVPWIYYFSYQWWMGNEIHLFDNLQVNFQFYDLIAEKALHYQIYIGALVVLMVVFLFRIYTNLLSDSIQTRKNINVILLYLVFLLLIVMSFSHEVLAFLPFIAFCLAMLVAHPFTLNKSKIYPLLFIVFVLLNIAFLLVNHFIF